MRKKRKALKGGTNIHDPAPIVKLVGSMSVTSVDVWWKGRVAFLQQSMCTDDGVDSSGSNETAGLALIALFQLHWTGHQQRDTVAAIVTSC